MAKQHLKSDLDQGEDDDSMRERHDAQSERREDVITVVLTADNHLGYTAFSQQPRKREERRQQLRHAFQQATDFAISQGVDLFIQAGDLFDTTTPDERDRSFVATHLAQLKQAGIRSFALGGLHDTPGNARSLSDESTLAPQLSYAHLGALDYLPPVQQVDALEPVMLDVHGVVVGICGLGVLADHREDPLAQLRVQNDIERAAVSILVLHAPIEGLTNGSSFLDLYAQVGRKSIADQSIFRYILAGYHHSYTHIPIGQTELIVAGATQYVDFRVPDEAPGFVFLGLAADGIRWCTHIPIETLLVARLVIHTGELWPTESRSPTEIILEQLHPLCGAETMLQLCLEGELTRSQYHQLDLNQIRRYGEEHSFALAIDDSALALLPEQDEINERFSVREELIALADDWMAAAHDEQEKKALNAAKEELLLAIEGRKRKGSLDLISERRYIP